MNLLVEKRSFGGLVGGYYLSIEFWNGDRKDFWFRHRLPLRQVYGAYFTPSFKPVNSKVVSAMEREVSVIILEWAEKINSLINAHFLRKFFIDLMLWLNTFQDTFVLGDY